MSRTLSLLAAVAFVTCAGTASAASYTQSNGQTNAMNRPATTSADRFASEGDARAHCPSDTVVWVNTRSHVYHFAGNPQFGHTKHGTFMCQADAARAGTFRAAKHETPPRRGSMTNMSGGSTPPTR